MLSNKHLFELSLVITFAMFGIGCGDTVPAGNLTNDGGTLPSDGETPAIPLPCPPQTCPGARLWGVGEPIAWNSYPNKSWPLEPQIDQVLALGAPIFRNWGAMSYCFHNATTYDESCMQPIKKVATTLRNAGVLVIQAEGAPPAWMTPNQDGKIPCRDYAAGSQYMQLMTTWQQTWTTLGNYFDTEDYWQIGNEWNHTTTKAFVPTACDTDGDFTYQEMVAIAADLTYFARKGLREGNPRAYAFLGAPAPLDSAGNPTLAGIAQYIDAIYSTIKSGALQSSNPRDYFDAVAWHPYVYASPTIENWVVPNQAIYNVMVAHGDGNVPVWFSEFGNGDDDDSVRSLGNADDMLSSWVLAQQHFPWLWGVTWFRMLNDPTATWGGQIERTMGIMADPSSGFSWKSSSYTMWSINHNIADAAPMLSFEFGDRGSLSGFVSANVSGLTSTGGNLLGVAAQDPQLASPAMQLDASQIAAIEITMSVFGSSSEAQMYFLSAQESTYSEAQGFHFAIVADGKPHKYRLSTADLASWQGTITQIRLDPGEGPGQFLVDSIRFLR